MHIAIYGSGQLARMMALAGWQYAWRFSFIADAGEDTRCVDGLGKVVTRNDQWSAEELYQQLDKPDVITVEKEMVDTTLLAELQSHCPVHPSPQAVYLCQNRRREKQFLRDLQLPTAPWQSATSIIEIEHAAKALGYPFIIKTDEAGYDGKNQWRINQREDLVRFMEHYQDIELTIEGFVSFQREVSLIAARSTTGEKVFYPLTENHHVNGILQTCVAPAPDTGQPLQAQAQAMIEKLLDHLDYVGVLSMECFVTEQGLLINELAPRVHNSGHWTQRLPGASQFENHIRAISGLSLGSTGLDGCYGMINILNPLDEKTVAPFFGPHSEVHHYDKAPREWRKLGHINLQYADHTTLIEAMDKGLSAVYPEPDNEAASSRR